MAQALVALRLADEATGAAAHHFAFFALRLAAADRAVVREDIGLAVLRPLLLHDLDQLGNDVAGALDRSGKHMYDLQSLMPLMYDVFCMKKKKKHDHHHKQHTKLPHNQFSYKI